MIKFIYNILALEVLRVRHWGINTTSKHTETRTKQMLFCRNLKIIQNQSLYLDQNVIEICS